MLTANHEIFKGIFCFLTEVSEGALPVVNTTFVTKQPAETNRIEFKLINFRNLSHNYDYIDLTGRNFQYGVDATYKASLVIRVITTPEQATFIAGNISNALQIFDYRDIYMPNLSILNHTLRQVSVPVEKNGVIFNLEQITVDCNMVLSFNINRTSSSYFDKVETVKPEIKIK